MNTFQICKNKLFDTYPSILHCPNDAPDALWFKLIEKVITHKPKVRLPSNITIITFNNTDSKMVLERTLDAQKVDYTVLGKGISKWTNPHKINLLKDNLKNVKTEFVLVLDAADVIIINSIHNIIDKFKQFKCNLLYNASSFIYPNETTYSSQESKLSKEFFGHLNSGCFIGYTNFCQEVYEQCSSFEDSITRTHHYSDQIKVKAVYVKMYPKIQIDSKCEIFQVFHARIALQKFIEMVYSNNIALL